jgi:hypothetical protein
MGRPPVDLSGQRFGRLVVVGEPSLQGDGRHALWPCRCDCGGSKVVESGNLRRGATRSCGCLAREVGERNREVTTIHGLHQSPEYVAWQNMISRCERPSTRGFLYYGGRGISVCEEWRSSFTAFHAHIGPRPSPGHSVDRIDNDGNYEPGNVRWATRVEQNNNRRPRRVITR